jgi:hypothetical protein
LIETIPKDNIDVSNAKNKEQKAIQFYEQSVNKRFSTDDDGHGEVSDLLHQSMDLLAKTLCFVRNKIETYSSISSTLVGNMSMVVVDVVIAFQERHL